MFIRREDRPRFVRDHRGRILTRADLPPPDTTRWVARRKAAVVAAVEGGLLTRVEACERWDLSEEELDSWIEAVNRHGPGALRVTRLKTYRQA
ncbi:MAG: DUF1153 domain-containing protein [Rubricella sp.]